MEDPSACEGPWDMRPLHSLTGILSPSKVNMLMAMKGRGASLHSSLLKYAGTPRLIWVPSQELPHVSHCGSSRLLWWPMTPVYHREPVSTGLSGEALQHRVCPQHPQHKILMSQEAGHPVRQKFNSFFCPFKSLPCTPHTALCS